MIAESKLESAAQLKQKQAFLETSGVPYITGSKQEEISRELLALANKFEREMEDPDEDVLTKLINFSDYAVATQEMMKIPQQPFKPNKVLLVPLTVHSFSILERIPQ